MVYGTARRVKSAALRLDAAYTGGAALSLLCVETPDNGHLTHLYGSCKFSRNCRADKVETPRMKITPNGQRQTSN
jgi:hypothetical protein